MFVSETSIRVLFHKAEAIVDRYLDTASQPWIKVRHVGIKVVTLCSEYNCR